MCVCVWGGGGGQNLQDTIRKKKDNVVENDKFGFFLMANGREDGFNFL